MTARPSGTERTPRRPWRGRRVLLGVTGGIAAYKSVQLARDLTLLGSEVDVVLTGAATEFVGPVTFEAVTGRPARTDDDMYASGAASLHLRLAREADAVCVAPATADFLARAAHGLADDLLATILLAATGPVVLCPAMNDRMYAHPAVEENLRRLAGREGVRIAGPGVGPLAAEEGEGPGRMLEPREILEHVGRTLVRESALEGRTVLVTAGPTREPLDPVRFVGNRSSGKMGYAVARAAWRRGARVVLVSGPVSLDSPPGAELARVETAEEMREAVEERIGEADVVVMVAAVADYRPADPTEGKVKRRETGTRLDMALTENPDILKETRGRRKEGAVVVGFALETEDLLEGATRKLEEKALDLVVANDPTEPDSAFGADTNRVTVLRRSEPPEELAPLAKDEVAEELLDRIETLVAEREG